MKDMIEQLIREKMELESQLESVVAVADRLGGYLLDQVGQDEITIGSEDIILGVNIVRDTGGIRVSSL